MLIQSSLFRSFFLGGIECSSQKLRSGKRLDMIASSGHDRFYVQDYQRLLAQGISTVRSGIRWHLIEQHAGVYDFSSVLPQVLAAQQMGMEVIWDLCHFGYPDDIDIFKPEFVNRFAALSQAFARLIAQETDTVPFICPVNEISFFSWAGGDVAYLNPFAHGQGFELKVQLARAAIAAIEAVWSVLPQTRLVHADPVIHIVSDPERPHEHRAAEGHRQAQFEGWDLISGRLLPQIGGNERYLDILGLNYYRNNQWILNGSTLERWHPMYRPFSQIAIEVAQRYQRPIFIAETGIEGDERPDWLRYMMNEVALAREQGVKIEGVCLYPIFNHPGWDDERHCHNGLWDYSDVDGIREIYAPLADELQRLNAVQDKPVTLRTS